MCRVRSIAPMGVIMLNQLHSSARRRLAVLGMLIGIGVFSIASVAPAMAQTSPTSGSVSVADGTSPDGVIGWD
jgi:hypothetical protein